MELTIISNLIRNLRVTKKSWPKRNAVLDFILRKETRIRIDIEERKIYTTVPKIQY